MGSLGIELARKGAYGYFRWAAIAYAQSYPGKWRRAVLRDFAKTDGERDSGDIRTDDAMSGNPR